MKQYRHRLVRQSKMSETQMLFKAWNIQKLTKQWIKEPTGEEVIHTDHEKHKLWSINSNVVQESANSDSSAKSNKTTRQKSLSWTDFTVLSNLIARSYRSTFCSLGPKRPAHGLLMRPTITSASGCQKHELKGECKIRDFDYVERQGHVK